MHDFLLHFNRESKETNSSAESISTEIEQEPEQPRF